MTPHELAAVHQHDKIGSLPIVSRALIEAEARCKRLEEAFRDLIRGYVTLMECGRDRIISLGGQCDSVEQMEREDYRLRIARAALREPGGGE